MKIPEINWQSFHINSSGHPELGIPAKYLIQPINEELHKHQGLIRNTNTEKIELDTPTITLNNGGFTLTGNVRIQARKHLGNTPIIGDTYTPWIPLTGTFHEQLNAHIIDGRLTVTHSQFDFVTSNNLYGQLAHDFILPYLQQEIVKAINQMLSSFNGMTLEELFIKYGCDKIQKDLDSKGLTKSRVKLIFNILSKHDRVSNVLQQLNQRLNSTQISARVTPDHLWLSAISIPPSKNIEPLEPNPHPSNY
jgi:hypothetical protein